MRLQAKCPTIAKTWSSMKINTKATSSCMQIVMLPRADFLVRTLHRFEGSLFCYFSLIDSWNGAHDFNNCFHHSTPRCCERAVSSNWFCLKNSKLKAATPNRLEITFKRDFWLTEFLKWLCWSSWSSVFAALTSKQPSSTSIIILSANLTMVRRNLPIPSRT